MAKRMKMMATKQPIRIRVLLSSALSIGSVTTKGKMRNSIISQGKERPGPEIRRQNMLLQIIPQYAFVEVFPVHTVARQQDWPHHLYDPVENE